MEGLYLNVSTGDNPLNKVVEQCDPYSAFGVFCNTNSFFEGLVIILGVVGLVTLSLIFVKKNQEINSEKHREKYKKYYQ
ncbi:hypothetical protein [Persephonella sp.]